MGAEGEAQRSEEAEKQGTHRVIMRDGEPCRPNQLLIAVTVGKHTSRMASWRGTRCPLIVATVGKQAARMTTWRGTARQYVLSPPYTLRFVRR